MMEPYVIHFAPLQGYTDSVYREAVENLICDASITAR